jgi:uracil-DNA glycosylase
MLSRCGAVVWFRGAGVVIGLLPDQLDSHWQQRIVPPTHFNGVTMPFSPAAISAIERVKEILAPIGDHRGAVMFSGVDTLRQGALYVMGYNPGGDASIAGTIVGSLPPQEENWNAWACQKWSNDGSSYSGLQDRIRSVFEALGADPRRTFSTNAIFERSNEAGKLEKPWDLWWNQCWRVHQVFLGIVRPRVIVCLGNPSTLDLLNTPKRKEGRSYDKVWDEAREGERTKAVEWQPKVDLDLGDGNTHTCAVIGLPHPSPRVHKGWVGSQLSPESMTLLAKARAAAAVGWEK